VRQIPLKFSTFFASISECEVLIIKKIMYQVIIQPFAEFVRNARWINAIIESITCAIKFLLFKAFVMLQNCSSEMVDVE
jgi:hypothetical protein